MKTATVIFLLSVILFGCSSSAQIVRRDATGGRVALEGAFMPAMGEARLMMAEYCDGRFDATEQGEAVEFRCRHDHGRKTPVALSEHRYTATHDL